MMVTEKSDLVEAFYVGLFGSEREQERVMRRKRAEEYPAKERQRVADLVRQTAEYEAWDRALTKAQDAFRNGNTACLDETIIPPTPELLSSGEFERFTADTVKGTVRSASTVRRKLMSHVQKYYESGLIELDALTACRWYRDVYEATGLTGNIPSTDYSKEIFSAPQSRSMFSDWQIDMQDMWRTARGQMTPRWLPFFDAVVLHDESPRIAIKLAKKRNGTEKALFRDVVAELVAAYDILKS